MAEVEEKTNGSGDAANQTKEQVYSAENLKSIEQKVEELKVSDNQVSDSAETAVNVSVISRRIIFQKGHF